MSTSTSAPQRPSRILVIDDSETQALGLRYLLEKEGWQVTCATTGEEALERLGAELPDLIVVDYYLPGIRGDELCHRIRMNVNTRNIPILMLTMDDTQGGESRGLESGADDYCVKSSDPDILVLRIRGLLRKSRAQTSVLARSEAHAFRQARLLAIDDSPTYLAYLSTELRREGYQVDLAATGAEGLARLSKADCDCVLVDLMMPEMNGVEVCRRLTELRRTMDNPVVVLMLTAKETKDDMTRGLEAGADDFVGKSSDITVLKARIRALLRRKFFQEENQRIIEELKNKELEAVRARAEMETAEAKAALAGRLEAANRELEETNRKLREAQMHLVQSEKMASLGQLVAGVAHEINNPLTFVLSNVFTIERAFAAVGRDVSGQLSQATSEKLERARARLKDMREGLERVRELVVKLRTFSRLDEGEFKTVDIHESIDSVLLFLGHKIKDRITVEKRYGPITSLTCFPGQLNQVIMNLVANAVDAIDGKGVITITTGEKAGAFFVSVRDTGRGIPESVRQRIFEPFFTTKPVGQGTGLGLAISYSIIQAHRGEIEVLSEVGRGTEFIVKIPLDLERRIKS